MSTDRCNGRWRNFKKPDRHSNLHFERGKYHFNFSIDKLIGES